METIESSTWIGHRVQMPRPPTVYAFNRLTGAFAGRVLYLCDRHGRTLPWTCQWSADFCMVEQDGYASALAPGSLLYRWGR